MNTNGHTPQEQQLMDQLRQLEKPVMRRDAVERLNSRLMDEAATIWPDQPALEPVATVKRTIPAWVLVAILTLITGMVLFAVINNLPQPEPVEIEESLITPTVMLTATPTMTPTDAPTTTATPTDAPTNTPEPTPLQIRLMPTVQQSVPVIVIEGEIERVADDQIEVFGQVIDISQMDDNQQTFNVGQLVRIEGESALVDGVLTIIAIEIIQVSATGGNNPPPANNPAPPPPVGDRSSRDSRDS